MSQDSFSVLILEESPHVRDLIQQVCQENPLAQAWGLDWSLEKVKSHLSNGGGLGAWHDLAPIGPGVDDGEGQKLAKRDRERVKGALLVGILLYHQNPQAWEIDLLAVHPRFLRRGVGQRLLNHWMTQKPPSLDIWLEVHEKNALARQFYQKLGFRETGRRKAYYPDGATAVLMTYLPDLTS